MTHTHQHIAVALFVRHPVPGRVKTRLARDLGNVAACGLYRAMVMDSIVNIKAAGLPLYIFHDGQDMVGLPMEWVSAADAIFSQSGDSLGERMTAAYNLLFSIGRERVLLSGSDIPGIDASLLQSAITELGGCDVVVSPAFDGGFCLVASRYDRFNGFIFQNVPWSTPRVLEIMLDRCKAVGLSYTLLDSRQDIDTLNDLKSYCRQPSSYATATNVWLVAHGFVIFPATV